MGFIGDSMKKVLVRAPVLTRTGYGEHGRFVMRCLRKIEDKIDIYLIPIRWGQSNWVWENSEEREWLDSLVHKTGEYQKQGGTFDVSLQVTIPNEWEKLAPVNIGITAGIETDRVSPVWLQKSNLMDKIVTISEHSKNGFVNTVYEAVNDQTGEKGILKCETPIEVVHYPTKSYKYEQLKLNLKTDFNFLTVAQWGPRKNVGATISWFMEEFFDNPEVGLIVKTFVKGGSRLDRKELVKVLKHTAKGFETTPKCKVYLLHGDMTEEEMHSLYQHPKIKAFVSLTHGEGFGLPHFECAYSGTPVIAPDFSGYMDFLCCPKKNKKGKLETKPYFATVKYDLKEVHQESHWEGVIHPDFKWAYAKAASYKMRLREMYKDHSRFKSQAKKLQKWVLENFSFEQQSEKLINFVFPQDVMDLEVWLENLDAEIHA